MKGARKQGGFSLIECLVAITIIGIGVVGVAGMFTYASVSEKKAAFMAKAREVAEDAIEDARVNGYAGLSGTSGSRTIATPGLPRSSGVIAWQAYPSAGTENGLKLVAVNINWHWSKGTTGKYRAVTLVSELGGA
ncbi:MAG: prepilin-type N-terminal cleavage/methylation domain-containing protein [Armatimonadota bacterium]